MKRFAPAHLPRMRKQRLIVDELPEEVLVYDLDRHKAHCLNKTAALVWRACDGKRSAADISRQLTGELHTPIGEDVVWLAIRQINSLHLLEHTVSLPPRLAGMSRRDMIRNLGIAAAVTIPVVTSIVSPTPAQASTCAGSGQVCGGGISCCTGICSNGHCVP